MNTIVSDSYLQADPKTPPPNTPSPASVIPVPPPLPAKNHPNIFHQMALCIRRHDLESLHTMVRSHGADLPIFVQMTGRDGESLLHVAIEAGYLNVVKLMVTMGHDVNRKSPSGEYPLLMAIHGGNEAIVAYLMQNGAHFGDVSRTSPLHAACQTSHVAVVKMLLDIGIDTGVRAENNCTPLHIAASLSVEICALLLERSTAEVNVALTDGSTPLHLACAASQDAIASLLILSGADVNRPAADGRSPLAIALAHKNVKLVTALIDAGSVPFTSPLCGHTVLTLLARDGMARHVCEVLPWFSNDELRFASGHYGDTALHLVARKGLVNAVTVLLARDSSVCHLPNTEGNLPLHLAVQGGCPKTVALLQPYTHTHTPGTTSATSATPLSNAPSVDDDAAPTTTAAASTQHHGDATATHHQQPSTDDATPTTTAAAAAAADHTLTGVDGIYRRNFAGFSALGLAALSKNAHANDLVLAVLRGSDRETAVPVCVLCCDNAGLCQLQACGHVACVHCLDQWVTVQVKDKRCGLNHLLCPVCSTQMAYDDVKRYTLSLSTLHLCDRLTLELCLTSQRDFHWCPFCADGGFLCSETCSEMECGTCGARSCVLCCEAVHEGMTCEENKASEEFQVGKWKKAHTKSCPECRVPIEKNGGCPDMNCRQCKLRFCWTCMESCTAHTSAGKNYPCH